MVVLIIFSVEFPAFAGNFVTSSNYHFQINNKDFFPIGWYDVDHSNFEIVKARGVNTILTYQSGITNHKNSLNVYSSKLKLFLDAAWSEDLYVITDIANLTVTEVSRVVLDDSIRTHPAMFAWYLADEPELHVRLKDSLLNTPDYLKRKYDTIRGIEYQFGDTRHPVIPVFSNPYFLKYLNICCPPCDKSIDKNCSYPPYYYPESYDALMADSYMFGMDPLPIHSDFNNVSRTITSRAMKQIEISGKEGFIFVAQGNDSPRFKKRKLSYKEIVYQSLSPIIHGARGLIYWSWAYCSPELKKEINNFIYFFTQFQLGDVVMQPLLEGMLSVIVYVDGKREDEYIWKKYNNGWVDKTTANFQLYNYILTSYDGEYYLFSVNDFRKDITVDFKLNNFVSVSLIENIMDHSNREIEFGRDHENDTWHFQDEVPGYAVKIYRIKP